MMDPESEGQERYAARLGMWVFLATEVLFVGALFAAYALLRIAHADAFILGSRETDLVLGTANTAVLLTSSLTMALAVDASRRNHYDGAARLLALTALLGIAFVGIKGAEYWDEWEKGLVPGGSRIGGGAEGLQLFFFLYFLMTGVHALHLIIGVVLLALFAVLVRRGPRYHGTVENLGLYWHFVDVVWIFLFPLLYLIGRA